MLFFELFLLFQTVLLRGGMAGIRVCQENGLGVLGSSLTDQCLELTAKCNELTENGMN